MNIRDIDIERTFALSSTLNFSRYIFKKKTGNKFIVGDHHVKICDALDKVVRGEVVISLSKIKIPKAQNQHNLCFRNQKYKCTKCNRNNYLCSSNYKANDYEQDKDSDIGL